MADPTFKIQTDYKNPPIITEEVPNEQIIRKMDDNSQDVTVTSTGTDTGYMLSPVITVTKKETALSKGDLKLQRVTVTEDISASEMENGNNRTSHDQSRELKKSRIPLLKFKQTVDRVRQENKDQLSKEKTQNTSRRSSIPKLKDGKLVKREFTKHESNSEPTSIEPIAMIENEFDKIYEEIVDNKQKDVDDKILAVKIEDPEKIETKFEEIIHSYDNNDDITLPGKVRLSKIPWRKKDSSKFGSLADKAKSKNSVTDPAFKDGGFKVSANNITTKRFSRTSSTDLSDIHKVGVIKNIEIQDDKEKEVIKETIVRDITEDIPTKTNINARGIKRELSVGDVNATEPNKRNDKFETSHEDKIKVEDVRTKRTGIPIPERINRSLSKELNKRPPNLHDRDFVNREVIKREEMKDANRRTIVKETPIETEKTTRSISRTFSRDGKSVTMAPKAKRVNVEHDKIITNGTFEENNKDSVQSINHKQPEIKIKDGNSNTENIVKETVKVGIPVYTRITQSYGKGKIQNIEISKTIEWKQADEVRTKNYVRGNSESKDNKFEATDKKFAPTVIKTDVIDDTNDDLNTEVNSDVNSTQLIDESNEITNIPLTNKTDLSDQNDIVESKDNSEETEDKQPNTNSSIENNNLTFQNPEKNMANVTILKGNVSRIISQISVKENQINKKEIGIEDDLPKKKSVLSKIAIFEGKEPAEFSVKIKKCFVGKKTSTTADNVNQNDQKISDTTQPKLDINVNINIDEDNTVTGVRNTPIIVDQIWKFEEQNIITHQINNVTTLPAAIDFTVTDISSDGIHEKLSPYTNEVIAEDAPISREAFDSNERSYMNTQFEEPQILPEKVSIESDIINKTEDAIILPAQVDFITNENQDNIVKYSAQKFATESKLDSGDEKKPKIGKLDLSLWKNQVEVNKQKVGTVKPNENQSPQILHKKIQESETPKIESRKIEVKSESQPAPPILPGNITSTHDDYEDKRPQITLESNAGLLEVPIILPETPLIKRDRIEFLSQRSQLQIPIILPEKIEPQTDINKVDSIQTMTGVNNAIQTIPDYIDFKEEQSKSTAEIPSEIESNSSERKVKTPMTVTEKFDFQMDENPDLVENIKTQPETTTKQEICLQDREVPSDPELVDSEPEAKETKDTIMGKLKNDIFFISDKRSAINKNINEEHQPSIPINNEEVNTIDSDLNNNTVQNGEFYTDRHDLDTKSDIEIGRSMSREDFKRTKSLAELDLGDAVKGQVQRMVYRIKSVDYDKLDAPKTRKISIKEMPKKCSVLEKIALFEGKVSNGSVKSEKFQKSETTSAFAKIQAMSHGGDSEELYFQKIEDLSTAKVRYGKMDMLYLNLGNDVQIPVIALGTALLDPRLTTHVVSAAIDLGYRAIDTAYIYGNEREVGQGIKAKIDDGTIKREDLYIISKLWSTFHHPKLVEKACRASLEALGLEYFDLYLIHNPMSFKEGGDPIPKIATVIQFSDYDYLDAWFVMEKLVSKGLVKNSGVSNFNSQQIQRIMDKGCVKPVINQVECHPYLSQHHLQMFCAERNITLSCFGVLGSKGTPSEYKSGVPAAIDDPLVQVMASGLNVTPAQLLVRYQIQQGRNAVVKASSASHLWDILQALTFQLQQHQIDALSALNRNKRIFTFKGMGDTHKNYPFRAPY